jgi:hypothetical protein
MALDLALDPGQFLRSVEASRDTLNRKRMKLIDVVEHVRVLTEDAPYAVIGARTCSLVNATPVRSYSPSVRRTSRQSTGLVRSATAEGVVVARLAIS